MTGSFTPRPRVDPARAGSTIDRWPALEASLIDLLSECAQIVEHGPDAFMANRSLTYRAAEAVIIHFDDLLSRLPTDRSALLPADLPLASVRRTRNILSHDYRAAQKNIVWDVIEQRIPQAIIAIVD
ncbi:HepT-like ribonuclease domain-containing protein [Curtobacterium sp. NPDC090217]|uniref:HepT-like ribonuclease domain-containing protein n=1 Tax=Curtobacterium sp. NPDC090217 TaxID=3363970 RepID=UPI0038141244